MILNCVYVQKLAEKLKKVADEDGDVNYENLKPHLKLEEKVSTVLDPRCHLDRVLYHIQ